MRQIKKNNSVWFSCSIDTQRNMEPMEIEESFVLNTLSNQSIQNTVKAELEENFCSEEIEILLNKYSETVKCYDNLRQEGNPKTPEMFLKLKVLS